MRIRSCLFLGFLAVVACSSTSSTSSSSSGGTGPADGGTTVDPGSSALAAACAEGGSGVVKDGWSRVIGTDFVAAKNGDVTVAIVYATTIDDSLRAANHFAEGVWDKLLGGEYTAGPRTSGGDGAGELPHSSGTATEIATGAQAFVSVTAARDNGVTFPVIAVAPDEATLSALLPTPAAIADMRRYNFFPLQCTSVVGNWSTSSVTVVDTNAGLKVSSLRLDLGLDASSGYTFDATVTSNSGAEKENDSGSYTSSDQQLALKSNAGFRDKTYDAGFVAVRGGVGLYIVDQQFSGDAWLLFRTK